MLKYLGEFVGFEVSGRVELLELNFLDLELKLSRGVKCQQIGFRPVKSLEKLAFIEIRPTNAVNNGSFAFELV